MDNSFIEVEKKDRLAIVTLNRPEVMNAIKPEMIQELQGALSSFFTDEETRVIIFQGAGNNFSSGADISLFKEDYSSPEWLRGMQELSRIVCTLREIPQPIVCKVRGMAVGAGANLALSSDFVLASENATFWEVFINLGAGLDAGGTYFLPRLVGLAKARELALLGEMLNGKKAASIGLIYKAVPEDNLDKEVDTLARTLSAKSSAALISIKHGLERSFDMSLRQVLDWEASQQAILFKTKEHREAVEMFLKSMGK